MRIILLRHGDILVNKTVKKNLVPTETILWWDRNNTKISKIYFARN